MGSLSIWIVARTEAPLRFAGNGITISMEYAPVDHPAIYRNMAAAFAEIGIPGMKPFPAAVSWGAMQTKPDSPINFTRLDRFVRNYQDHGFTGLCIALNPKCRWGCKDCTLLKLKNASPKPKYRDLYSRWVHDIVERYDGDGHNDMPNLRVPVRLYEIGTEFSSFQPEPVGEYLDTLSLVYSAAHSASPDVLIAHAAFHLSPVNMNVVDPAEYDAVWNNTQRRDTHHGLADMRRILDHLHP